MTTRERKCPLLLIRALLYGLEKICVWSGVVCGLTAAAMADHYGFTDPLVSRLLLGTVCLVGAALVFSPIRAWLELYDVP